MLRVDRYLHSGRWLAAAIVGAAVLAWQGEAGAFSLRDFVRGTEQLTYKVWRKGDGIGRHEVRFRRDGNRLFVDIDAEIRVKMFMFTVYAYKQRVREEWQNGSLVKLSARTVEDGREYTLQGHATKIGFQVSGASGDYVAPADILPTSYWHPATLSQTRLLDLKTGAIMKVRITKAGTEAVDISAGKVGADRFEVHGDLRLTLWYDTKRQLAQAWFKAPEDGSWVEYVRDRLAYGQQAAR